VRRVAVEEKLTCFDIYPRYAAEQAKGPNMLNYRRFPLAKIPPKLHELAKPYVSEGRGGAATVEVLDNRLDAHFGNLPAGTATVTRISPATASSATRQQSFSRRSFGEESKVAFRKVECRAR